MARTAVTPSPGFISIQVSDVTRSAEFYEQHLGAVRDTFDFGPDAVAYVGWPTFGLSAARRPGQSGPSPETTTIQLWWRASDAQALFDKVKAAGVRILTDPLGPRDHFRTEPK
jgi:catechol 2,3-dioxygenase-like lactoylglutathione lyase family enzyme